MTSTLTWASPPAPAAQTNPHNLAPGYHGYWANGTMVTPEFAFEHFHGSRNPFIVGSPQSDEYLALVENHRNRERQKWLKLPEYPVVMKPSKRRLSMPRFKIPFETEHDASMRLSGSLIFVGTNLAYIRQVRKIEDDYLLVIEDRDGKNYRVWYGSDAVDLRSPEPQYIVYSDRPAFFGRYPSRQQRQGIDSGNSFVKPVGSHETLRLHDFGWLLKKMDAPDTVWNPTLYDLMMKAEAFGSLRLSKNLSFYRKDDKAFAEYKGRLLGEVNDDTIKIDASDRRPWIDRDVKSIGCTLRV